MIHFLNEKQPMFIKMPDGKHVKLTWNNGIVIEHLNEKVQPLHCSAVLVKPPMEEPVADIVPNQALEDEPAESIPRPTCVGFAITYKGMVLHDYGSHIDFIGNVDGARLFDTATQAKAFWMANSGLNPLLVSKCEPALLKVQVLYNNGVLADE